MFMNLKHIVFLNYGAKKMSSHQNFMKCQSFEKYYNLTAAEKDDPWIIVN